jgi:hypothetical protein
VTEDITGYNKRVKLSDDKRLVCFGVVFSQEAWLLIKKTVNMNLTSSHLTLNGLSEVYCLLTLYGSSKRWMD